MKSKLIAGCCVLGIIAVMALAADYPLQWIVSVAKNISAGDKTKLANAIKTWVGKDELGIGWPPPEYANAAGQQRYIQCWHDCQLSRRGVLTQAKINAARALLDNSNSVWITSSYNPVKDLQDAGWTNCIGMP